MRDAALLRPARRGLAALAVLAVLALAGLAAVRSILPPAAAPASAPAGQFSAERAFAEVRTIAATPHPAGSAANDRVREHLLAHLRGLGLSPQVQDTVSAQGGELSASAGGTGLARVRNVVTLLPGAASTGRIFLVAHYDSAQTGPGGNDDAAGVATILETARALTSGARLRNDVVLVLTDAEEACLCGAEAFVRQHPLARDGGVALNLEARGSSGPAIMFETSARNAELVEAYARAPYPVGTSFAVEIYRRLPNDTDFTAFRRAGFRGLNSAYIDGAAVYHAPTDRPSAMDRDSLQHHGANALAVTRELGGRDLTTLRGGADATYFPVPGGGLVHYPGALVWPLAVLALAAVAALAWLARRRGRLTGRRLALAGALTPVPLVVAPALAQALWAALTLIRPEYGALPIDPYRPGLYRVAVIALAVAVVLGWFAVLRRRVGAAALAVAGLGWLAGLGAVLAAVTPGGAYLATLPALAGALAGLAALAVRGWAATAAITVGGLVAVVILLPTVLMLFPALGMALGAAGAFLTVLLVLALLPVVDLIHPPGEPVRGLAALRARRRGALPTLAASLAVLVCAAAGLVVDRFDAEHPALTQLMYALDADTGTARWLSDEARTQTWTAQYVSGDRKPVTATLPAFGDERLRGGPARPATLAAPDLTLEADTLSGDGRVLTLRLKPRRAVRFTTLHVAAATEVTAATVGGRTVPSRRPAGGGWGFGFVFHAPPAEGVVVTLAVRGAGPVRLRAMDASDNVSEMPGFRARPAGVGVLGSHSSEMVAVAKTYEY
ncbi:M28 family peptidase [Actinoplanes teichomyceticus]|uniref:Vacuolar membrane protease n=1 Tax=Actinoplanes teichomyceticus TaxID=1867 RepID=A0A561VQU3_ACTTI|nr:M28 family peptidase [Actinoplanes teichomyceticus]TWG13989.1 peptidase M28-like protein [Actinoplanes teichomyceticus]GIF12190.1 aminopeptidase [Actinoplanes teichomyceticus]